MNFVHDKRHKKEKGKGRTLSGAPSLREFVLNPSREKAILENPQIFQNCEIINNSSAEYAQSKRGAHSQSSR